MEIRNRNCHPLPPIFKFVHKTRWNVNSDYLWVVGLWMTIIFIFMLLWILKYFQNGMVFPPWFVWLNITHALVQVSSPRTAWSHSVFPPQVPLTFLASRFLTTTVHKIIICFLLWIRRYRILFLYQHTCTKINLFVELTNKKFRKNYFMVCPDYSFRKVVSIRKERISF